MSNAPILLDSSAHPRATARELRNPLTRTAAAVLVAGAILLLNRNAMAQAIPTPVEVSSANVEKVFALLETKAATVDDTTWTTMAGPDDTDPVRWIMALKGKAWSMSLNLPDRDEWLLYCDGAGYWELPRRVRLDLETVEDPHETETYGGFILLWANLHPRQFLQATPGLVLVGQETIDGTGCLHLRAEPQSDEDAKAGKPAVRERWRATIDYYYDGVRNAITRVVISRGWVIDARIVAWDAFGTPVQWPKRITTTRSVPGQGRTYAPHVVAVQSLARGNEVTDQAKVKVTKAKYYEPLVMKPAEVYLRALQADPANFDNQVLYATALAKNMNCGAAMEYWWKVEQGLKDPVQKQALLRSGAFLAFRACGRDGGPADRARAADLLAETVTLLDADGQWCIEAWHLLRCWQALRKALPTDPRPRSVTARLFEAFVNQGQAWAVRDMLQAAEKDPVDAEAINPVVTTITSRPLPPQGFVGSPLACLVNAAILLDRCDQAAAYLKGIQWDPATEAGGKAPALVLQELVQAATRARAGEVTVAADLAEQYSRVKTAGFAGGDRASIDSVRKLAEQLGASLLQARPQAVTEAIRATVAAPEAAAYWDAVLLNLMGRDYQRNGDARQATIKLIVDAAAVIQNELKVADYQSRVNLLLAGNRVMGIPLEAKVPLCQQAMAQTTNETVRLEALQRMVTMQSYAGQFDQAGEALASAKESFTSDRAKQAIGTMENDLAQAKAKPPQARVNVSAMPMPKTSPEVQRLNDRLAYLKQRLSAAQQLNKPQTDIDALQQQIQQTEKDLAKLKAQP